MKILGYIGKSILFLVGLFVTFFGFIFMGKGALGDAGTSFLIGGLLMFLSVYLGDHPLYQSMIEWKNKRAEELKEKEGGWGINEMNERPSSQRKADWTKERIEEIEEVESARKTIARKIIEIIIKFFEIIIKIFFFLVGLFFLINGFYFVSKGSGLGLAGTSFFIGGLLVVLSIYLGKRPSKQRKAE